MRYLISFVDDLQAERQRLLDVCVVDGESKSAALATARVVCRRSSSARVVLIPGQITVDAADLGRRIPLEQASALCRDLERQMASAPRHGGRR